jgi:predicted histidine transporter YuiF (NhaC family)
VAALAGVGAGFAMILVFLLPTLRRGENAAAVTLVGTVAVMLVVLYASHGVSAKTTTALFGTVAALGVTAGAAVWAASAAHQGQRFTLQAASAHANSTYPPGEDRAEPEALDVRHSSPEEFERSLVTGESMSRL